jgi:hypothetical protein
MTTTQRVARKEKRINKPCALPAQAMSPPDTPCLPKQTKRQSLRDHWRNRMSALPDTHSGSRSGTHRCICEGERKEGQCPASYTQSDLVKEKLTSCANTPFHARLRRHTDCISASLAPGQALAFLLRRHPGHTRDPGGRPACTWCTPLSRRWDR